MAGSKQVLELHGSIHAIRCHQCNSPSVKKDFLDKNPCEKCGGPLRPGVVLFGERLPENTWHQAIQTIREAELVLVIGTSLQVYPVNQLPSMTDGKIVILNAEATEMDDLFHLVCHGKAGEILRELDGLLKN
jgi:NAD-dependent deacetylase